MNKMKEVAQLIGLEWDDNKQESEVFEIIDRNGEFKITGTGFVVNTRGEWTYSNRSITYLLVDTSVIKKKPWVPKEGTKYYFPNIRPNSSFKSEYLNSWKNDTFDKSALEMGFVCKTQEEAEALHDKIVEFVRKERGL